jgi:hypothetical protein
LSSLRSGSSSTQTLSMLSASLSGFEVGREVDGYNAAGKYFKSPRDRRIHVPDVSVIPTNSNKFTQRFFSKGFVCKGLLQNFIRPNNKEYGNTERHSENVRLSYDARRDGSGIR